MKGVKHYTEGGKEWKGGTHKMDDGVLHTGSTHTDDSKKLVHKNELKKSKTPFKLREVNSPMKCWKTHKRKPGTKEFSKGSCIPK